MIGVSVANTPIGSKVVAAQRDQPARCYESQRRILKRLSRPSRGKRG